MIIHEALIESELEASKHFVRRVPERQSFKIAHGTLRVNRHPPFNSNYNLNALPVLIPVSLYQ
jgi:hypothetical protein